MTDATPFDLTGPLPRGTCVLEASAGTGKTYTIAGLVTRYVAEADVPLPRILVVTFTRAATAELRERVRRRLVEAAAHCSAVLSGTEPTHPDDEVLTHLASTDDEQLRTRLARLEAALGEFDAATVATIHGFCQQVLVGLGVAGDVDRGAELLEDTSTLVDEAVGDLLVRRFHDRAAGLPIPSRQKLDTLITKVLGNPDAMLVPQQHGDPTVQARIEVANELRAVVDERKRRTGTLGFDDLLTRLADTLGDPDRGDAARAALRRQYQVALIDEFQDTDPVQWRIVRNAFGDLPDAPSSAAPDGDERALVLIGDPKQAIYAFRGADIHAYLAAVDEAAARHTLGTNHRSDAPVLEGLAALFKSAQFGDRRIRFQPVVAAPRHQTRRLTDPAGTSPVVIRHVPLAGGVPLARTKGRSRRLDPNATREHIAADVACEVVRLLDPTAPVTLDEGGGPRPLRTGDIAVLVRSNAEAALVQRTLLGTGVPAIINGVGSVFSSDAALHWRTLLDALQRPTDDGRARAVAFGPLIGWGAERLAAADEDSLTELHDLLHDLAAVLRDHGVATLLQHLSVRTHLHARLLATDDGERLVTDIEHLGELLHAAAAAEHLGAGALRAWLDERITEADDEGVAPDARARRLESDAAAVQILTVHRSKGLEFPVVLAPFLWNANVRDDGVPAYHDGTRRVIDVSLLGGTGDPQYATADKAQKKERRGEELRLLYVAATRAACQLTLWWAPAGNAADAALTRAIVCRGSDGAVKPCDATAGLPDDDEAADRFGRLEELSGGAITWTTTPRDPVPARWAAPAVDPDTLAVARFDRGIDTAWYRTSYSRLTTPADVERTTGVAPVEPETSQTDDEPGEADGAGGTGVVVDAPPAPDHAGDPGLLAARSPLADLPGGTEFGTLVHTVLEHVDPQAPDLERVVAEEVERRLRRARMEVDPVALTDGLVAALRTPLGPVLGGRALVDVPRTDLLPELEFELPLVGATGDGDGRARLADVADLLDAHLPTGDPLAHYADVLRGAGFTRVLRGYLTGSIDLVVRVVDDGVPRYVVVDHKTNRLGVAPRSAADYTPAALADAMVHGHYPLQALLYAVAAHRLLRWRQPGYDPDVHLGGTAYLFLRGMTGPTNPTVDGQPCGVFGWRPPSTLVVALSDLLDTGRTDGGASA
ncbi:MAG: UvrD-helicase domain-containing protein [Actinomycetes bacterium]